MNCIDAVYSQTLEVKKSVFHSFLLPYSEFENKLKELKQKHPKANHMVWAYRYINENMQITENSSDDGEPKGCAAAPTLNRLRGYDLIESALITVRYFGGVRLGTGGMARAYGESAKKVIENSNILPYVKKELFVLKTPYSLVHRFEHFLNRENIDFSDRVFRANEVVWNLKVSDDEREKITLHHKLYIHPGK